MLLLAAMGPHCSFDFTDPPPLDPTADSDGDGLPDGRELELGTDPHLADSDGDGLGDLLETTLGTLPSARSSSGSTTCTGVRMRWA